MKELDMNTIRELCNEGKIIWTVHIVRKLQERGVFQNSVFHAISNGQIIEQYPDDYPHPSCLIFGRDINNNPLHIVIGCDGMILYLITAYQPDNEHFEDDFISRKEN